MFKFILFLSPERVREINKINYNNSQTVLYKFSIMSFTSIPTARTSEAIEAINVNPFTKVVNVRFTNGYEYKYSNVSRAKIVNLMLNPNMSFGFWIQDLVKQAIRELSYLRGNTVATGKLCYQMTGVGYKTDALPF